MKNFLVRVTAGTQTWLTIFVTTVYNLALLYGVMSQGLSWKDYIFAVGPINTMVMAFWLGSETALRQPPLGVPPQQQEEQK